jgi:hypothetical protein
VSNSPHQLSGQARHDSCSPHWITGAGRLSPDLAGLSRE